MEPVTNNELIRIATEIKLPGQIMKEACDELSRRIRLSEGKGGKIDSLFDLQAIEKEVYKTEQYLLRLKDLAIQVREQMELIKNPKG